MKKSILIIFFILSYLGFSQQNIPNISLTNLDKEKINLKELSSSKNLIIFSFWATWCVPCINELDAISEVYEEWQKETNVELIAISTDDSRTKRRVKPMVNGKGWEYQILLDDNQELKRALNITLLPHIVVVKKGEIVHRRSGYTPGGEDELFEVIKKYSN